MGIEITNPEYITDAVFSRLKKWVHNWILSRIPDRHHYLVSGVAKGDLEDLFAAFLRASHQPRRLRPVQSLWMAPFVF